MYNKFLIPALAIFSAAILAEVVWAWKKKKSVFNVKETASNFFIFGVLQLIKPLTLAWQVGVLAFFSQFQLWKIPMNVGTILLAVVFVDLLYYVQHRLLHENRFLWTLHNVHHSSPWMNLTTSFRLNWLGPLVSPFFYVPAILLGFQLKAILVFFFLNLVFQFFLHTESIDRIPFLEGWLNTPSAHRVHHGSNPLYIDKNYGGILMVWDRMFGTYQKEEEPVKYGVTTGFMGHNPFKVVFLPIIQYFRGDYTREIQNIPEEQRPSKPTTKTTPTPTPKRTKTPTGPHKPHPSLP